MFTCILLYNATVEYISLLLKDHPFKSLNAHIAAKQYVKNFAHVIYHTILPKM